MKKHGLLKHYSASQIFVATICFGTGFSLLTALSIRAQLTGTGSDRSLPPMCAMPLPPIEPLERGCRYMQGLMDEGCPFFKKVCEQSSASSQKECPAVVMPPFVAGCRPEKTLENGCPTVRMHCENRSGSGSSSAISRPVCPLPPFNMLAVGCRLEKAEFVNGCPTWKSVCEDQESSRSIKSEHSCPEHKSTVGMGYGCPMLPEQAAGCDPVVLCIDPPLNPTSSVSPSSRPVAQPMKRCPEMGEIPGYKPGCFSYIEPTENGCMTWKTKCASESSSVSDEHEDDDEQESSSEWQDSSVPPAGYEEPIEPSKQEVKMDWFSDVSENEEIGITANTLAEEGIGGGYSDGTFRPNQPVNRAEAAKFLVLAVIGDFQGSIRNSGKFHDVADDEWYTKYVMAASVLQIIQGNADGTFRPGSPVNTAEFLKMLALTFDLQADLPGDYQDVGADDWFAPYAGVAQQYELFPNRGSYLEPERAMTRGEVAYAISRILNR